jgi:hypothetical protein
MECIWAETELEDFDALARAYWKSIYRFILASVRNAEEGIMGESWNHGHSLFKKLNQTMGVPFFIICIAACCPLCHQQASVGARAGFDRNFDIMSKQHEKILDGQARMQLPHRKHRPANLSSLIAPGGRNGALLDLA